MGWLKGLWRAEEGQGLVEYSFLLMLVALVVMTALGTLGLMAANALLLSW
ncbi:MAG: Flp family type IVb pilin [bacterium]|jgi:Flp pilus assembly pilin Flp